MRGDSLRSNDLPFSAAFEWIGNDGSFGDAFAFGTVSPADQRALAKAGSALVLRLPVDLSSARKAIGHLASKLAGAGALAV